MDFEELARLEPRLEQLERDAFDAHREGRTSWSDWERIKRALTQLCGWSCGSRHMRLVDGWDVAYRHLLSVWETGRRPTTRRATPDIGLSDAATKGMGNPMLRTDAANGCFGDRPS
jgi:hypothetical protein